MKERLQNTAITDSELYHVLTYRANLEEDYGRRLLKLSKHKLGENEIGTAKAVLDKALCEMAVTGQEHLTLAQEIRDCAEKFEKFSTPNAANRKRAIDGIRKTVKDRNTMSQYSTKAEQKYFQKKQELREIESQEAQIQKDAEKKQKRVEKYKQYVRESKDEYREAVARAQRCYTIWQKTTFAGFQVLQETEELRFTELKECMKKLSTSIRTAAERCHDSIQIFYEVADISCVQRDMEMFISTCGTGSMLPMKPIFDELRLSPHLQDEPRNLSEISLNERIDDIFPKSTFAEMHKEMKPEDIESDS